MEVQEDYIEALRAMLKGTAQYIRQLQITPILPTSNNSQGESRPQDTCDRTELGKKMVRVKALYTKMHQELAMAKREIALGKLRAGDISTITDLCRRIIMPMYGYIFVPTTH